MSNSSRCPNALLSVWHVSQLLQISERTVRRRIADGQYARVKFSPRRIRIDAARSVVFLAGLIACGLTALQPTSGAAASSDSAVRNRRSRLGGETFRLLTVAPGRTDVEERVC